MATTKKFYYATIRKNWIEKEILTIETIDTGWTTEYDFEHSIDIELTKEEKAELIWYTTMD